MSKTRIEGVFPTRMNLTTFKTKKKGAQKGYELLKKKADALKASIDPTAPMHPMPVHREHALR